MDCKQLSIKQMVIKDGYNQYSSETDARQMLLDIGVLSLKAGKTFSVSSETKEKAVLIYSGEIKISYQNKEVGMKRKNVFVEKPQVLHVSKDVDLKITALKDSELLVQQKTNQNKFESKFYNYKNIKITVTGVNYNNTVSRRKVVDIFNYDNAPYSNMVLGEVVTAPGNWSGFPPHNHPQPETYIFKFSRKHGYGFGFGDDMGCKVEENGAIFLPGEVVHQNACAPGYQMYFTWMIPHLPGKPWVKRVYDPNQEWMNEPNVVIKEIEYEN